MGSLHSLFIRYNIKRKEKKIKHRRNPEPKEIVPTTIKQNTKTEYSINIKKVETQRRCVVVKDNRNRS